MSQPQARAEQACQCHSCTALPTVRTQLLDFLTALDIEGDEDISTASCILNDLENLQTSIALRHEAAARVAAANGLHSVEHQVPSRKDSVVLTRSGDAMVCDHCAFHGIPCERSPVCVACSLMEQPCIRRWCALEGGQHGACTDCQCCYAHGEFLPIDEPSLSTEDYIILPGEVPERCASNLMTTSSTAKSRWVPTIGALKQKQQEARQQLFEWSGGDDEKVRELYYPCGDGCRAGLVSKESKAPSADVQMLKALGKKLLGKS
ncbi:uncharacterized protein LTR77_003810 [Saxophila tyrrhenica]|uniref:Uncharacterized protein n=1 Tax=Saxophila tyrrhenica TaxID=1690608 RepID=A0AAV9PIY1_9PEZI|nr:hypothetical protein LTR77_003810 [Saxophila tyrrhenica]